VFAANERKAKIRTSGNNKKKKCEDYINLRFYLLAHGHW
jgi:hypothetical protein